MGLKEAWNALRKGSNSPQRPETELREPTEEQFRQAETLEALAQQVHGHHAELAQLRLEWAETLDKFTAWSNRQAARDRVRLKRAMAAQDDSEEGEGSPPQPEQFREVVGQSGEPFQVPNGHRHPKADLYARIRGR